MHNSKLFSVFSLLLTFSFFACAQDNAEQVLTSQNRILGSTVVLNNSSSLIPLSKLGERRIAVAYGTPAFDSLLNRYAKVEYLTPDRFNNPKELEEFNTLIIQVNDALLLNPDFISRLTKISEKEDLIVAGFGDLSGLQKLESLKSPIIWSEDTSRQARMLSAEIIFGGVAASGKLSSTVSPAFSQGDGYHTQQTRLRYGIPEAVGIDGKDLTKKIDAIAAEMISGKAAPGAVVMIVKDNQVIFEKAYGNHYYDREEPTRADDIFDMASISKIASTTLAVMRLDEKNKISLDQTMGHYIKEARKTNKKDIKLRDVMLHQAGFIPFIPFYRDLKPGDFRSDSSAAFPVKVAENYFLRKNYFEEVMWPQMLQSAVKPVGNYVYSDISMYVMQKVVENVTGKSLDRYVKEEFYKPLGMYSTGYNAWKYFPRNRIVPTELDKTFRNSQLIGYVHDQGAAMANGVAGHAGLFSTAGDLAIYGQMLLNKGTYGGETYFQPETVEKYTRQHSDKSRRGLGFDRWDPDMKNEYPSKLASPATFGHTGYTGTAIWMDPQENLIYIFLSNRVQPDVSPFLSKLEIRARILDTIYEAIPKK